jgi:hypothetical protein
MMQRKLRADRLAALGKSLVITAKARILLYELEQPALLRELRSSSTSTGRRAEIYRRQPHLKFDHTEAVNDLAWFTAEERLRRPDPLNQVPIGDGTHTVSFS